MWKSNPPPGYVFLELGLTVDQKKDDRHKTENDDYTQKRYVFYQFAGGSVRHYSDNGRQHDSGYFAYSAACQQPISFAFNSYEDTKRSSSWAMLYDCGIGRSRLSIQECWKTPVVLESSQMVHSEFAGQPQAQGRHKPADRGGYGSVITICDAFRFAEAKVSLPASNKKTVTGMIV